MGPLINILAVARPTGDRIWDFNFFLNKVFTAEYISYNYANKSPVEIG